MSSIQSIPSRLHVLAKLSGSRAGSGGSIYSYPYKLWSVGEGGGGEWLSSSLRLASSMVHVI